MIAADRSRKFSREFEDIVFHRYDGRNRVRNHLPCRYPTAGANRRGLVSNVNSGFLRFFAKSSRNSARFGLLRALSVAMAGLVSFSCGSSHAILEISVPAAVVAGSPFTATVTAMYNGQRDTSIDGPIHFTTSDKAAALPTLYVFTAADAGSHTFTGLTLVTPGSQTMTVSDYDATPIAGTVNIMVSAPAN
jgi:hypothetical protein